MATTAPAAKQDTPATSPVEALLGTIRNKKEDDRSMAEAQISRAATLEKERADLMERIGKNRDFLRLLGDNEALTDVQRTWVDTFYPEKEKGERRSAEDIEATRKLRESVRK